MRRRLLTNWAIEEPTINITPLIDVVFVVLIMFIVVAPFLEIDRVELVQGSAVRDEVISLRDSAAIKITVDKSNQIKFNNIPVSIERIDVLMREAKESNSQIQIQLYQDEEAPFGTYQKIKNAAEAAGFQAIDVVVKPG